MIITFCGHSDFSGNSEYRHRLLSFLEERVAGQDVCFYMGVNGGFDSFAYSVSKEYKKSHPSAKVIFVTPYISESYQKNHLEYYEERFDEIIYPDLESVPPKFAISKRNEWLVQKADLVIAYVNHPCGGAYKTFSLAKKRGKELFNLGSLKTG